MAYELFYMNRFVLNAYSQSACDAPSPAFYNVSGESNRIQRKQKLNQTPSKHPASKEQEKERINR